MESCVSACQSQSFTIAGLEYAQECCESIHLPSFVKEYPALSDDWLLLGCGNEINSPGAPISQSSCNQACIGDNMEICGGPNALQVYY